MLVSVGGGGDRGAGGGARPTAGAGGGGAPEEGAGDERGVEPDAEQRPRHAANRGVLARVDVAALADAAAGDRLLAVVADRQVEADGQTDEPEEGEDGREPTISLSQVHPLLAAGV